MYYYTCQRCGKDFENKNKGKKYCSYDCAKRWKLKESKKCVFCGKQFRRPGNAGKYCSQKCTKEDSKRGMEQPCTQCGKIFYVPDCKDKQHKKNQFCSNKCSRKFQVNRRPVRTCVECGKKFKKKGNSDAKFCGLQCKMY